MAGNFFSRMVLFGITNIAVLAVFGVVLQVLGLDRAGYDTVSMLIFAALFGFSGSLISLAMSKSMAIRSTRAHVVDTPRNEVESWLVSTVRRQAEAAGIGMPQVGIFPSSAPNAFATGARRNAAFVAVSEGLLRSMDKREVEAVLAHEIAHVANGDMVTMTLLQGVVNTFVIFLSRLLGRFIDQAVFKRERGYGPGYYIASLVGQVVFGFVATIIVRWFSRRREFRADHGAAQLEGPEAMISALEALKGGHDEVALPKELAAFGIDSGSLKGLIATHPSLDSRIAALREFKG